MRQVPMLLCLDVGNTHILGGVFHDESLVLTFRKSSKTGCTSDEVGVFLRGVLRENQLPPEDIDAIALCTVVPEVQHSLRNACLKYFKKTPFVLEAGVKTGLKIKVSHPGEVGADLIAGALAATTLHPNQNLLIVDLGTATTVCAVGADRSFLGGVIAPGMRLKMEALEAHTSKLPTVEILKPPRALGRDTVSSIQAGLYYGKLGMLKEVLARVREEAFAGQAVWTLGTGGFAGLFKDAGVFDEERQDLVLLGLRQAYTMNL